LNEEPKQEHDLRVLEWRDRAHAREFGKIGTWFGSRANAPTFVAGILSCFFAVVLALILFLPLGEGITRRDALQIVGGFFFAAIGYLFGSRTGGGNGQ
jgi:hypothetical protein